MLAEQTEPTQQAWVYEEAIGNASELVADLSHLGWTCLHGPDIPETATDLWVLNLVGASLVTIPMLRDVAGPGVQKPLLIVAGVEGLAYLARELTDLHRGWSGTLELLMSPYSRLELELRLAWVTMVRQPHEVLPITRFQLGKLVLDTEARAVWFEDRKVPLSRTDYSIFSTLVRSAGKVVSLQELQLSLPQPERPRSPSFIEAYIRRLRGILTEVGVSRDAIVTVRGHGYRLDASALH